MKAGFCPAHRWSEGSPPNACTFLCLPATILRIADRTSGSSKSVSGVMLRRPCSFGSPVMVHHQDGFWKFLVLIPFGSVIISPLSAGHLACELQRRAAWRWNLCFRRQETSVGVPPFSRIKNSVLPFDDELDPSTKLRSSRSSSKSESSCSAILGGRFLRIIYSAQAWSWLTRALNSVSCATFEGRGSMFC